MERNSVRVERRASSNMRLQKKIFRREPAALTKANEQHPERRPDIWLTRFANLSQPLLLCLAVFGYFYTVIPVYQKEVLSEQIASKEIELGRLQRAIDATGPTMERLKNERATLEERLERLNAQRNAAEQTVAELNRRQSLLESKNRDLDAARSKLVGEVASVEASAKTFSVQTYHDSFSASVILQYIGRTQDPYKIVDAPTYEAIAEYLLTPYAAVSSMLAAGDSRFMETASRVSRATKDEYHARVRSALEARRDALSKPQDDVNALLLEIKDGMAQAAIDPTPADRFNKKLFETRQRLVKMLQESRQREWDRTQKFLASVAPVER